MLKSRGDLYGILGGFESRGKGLQVMMTFFVLKSRGILLGFQTCNLQRLEKGDVKGIFSRQIPRWNLWYKVGHQL